MSQFAIPDRFAGKGEISSRHLFALATLGLMAGAALLAGWAPLGFSIVTVFLFAGPHNWMELRYFMGRMPGRWGRLRTFFLCSFGGVLGLTGAFASLSWIAEGFDWNTADWTTALALWNTAFVLWIVTLIQMRSRQNPKRDWFWTLPVAFALIGVNWLSPWAWGLALVYLHPFMAFWILDRELRRSKPEWRGTYHACLACVPVVLGILWWRLANAPPLPGNDLLSEQITNHAGAGLLRGVSSHLLVATHTFLEMLHYSVWLIAIPLVGLRTVPWKIGSVPLAWRSAGWRTGLMLALGASACVVLLLWACFLADYPATRDVYFTVAMVHVLAEVPFLLRSL
jgi:hypothetical protein